MFFHRKNDKVKGKKVSNTKYQLKEKWKKGMSLMCVGVKSSKKFFLQSIIERHGLGVFRKILKIKENLERPPIVKKEQCFNQNITYRTRKG